MRRALVAVAFVALALVLAFPATAAPRSPFVGLWRAVDGVDGSNLLVAIGGGRGRYVLTLLDDYWSLCDGEPGIGRGTGTVDAIDPTILHTDLVCRCLKQHKNYAYQLDFDYDPATDTAVFAYSVFGRVRHATPR
jgi:hypothetical protein